MRLPRPHRLRRVSHQLGVGEATAYGRVPDAPSKLRLGGRARTRMRCASDSSSPAQQYSSKPLISLGKKRDTICRSILSFRAQWSQMKINTDSFEQKNRSEARPCVSPCDPSPRSFPVQVSGMSPVQNVNNVPGPYRLEDPLPPCL